jgi:hypothetical protein
VENLRKLEIIKLIKELDFVISEYRYKSEMIREIDQDFHKAIENVLDNNNDLKDIFIKNVDFMNEQRQRAVEEFTKQKEIEIIEEITESKNPKLKSLYRIIAKSTHPDKVNDENLKEVYIEATKAYEENNLFPIINICEKLKIPYDVTEEEFHDFRSEIDKTKKSSEFLETTFAWQWYVAPDDEKSRIVFNFIRNQIIK